MTEPTQVRMTCTKCGGSHFQLATFRQYRGDTYSSTPGGELIPLDGPTVDLRICLCGQPVAPRKVLSLPPNVRMSVKASLEQAERFRKMTELETITLKLQEDFAPRHEVRMLAETVANLSKVLEQAPQPTEQQLGEVGCKPKPASPALCDAAQEEKT